MAGLEPVGIAGPEHLREALTNCSDPLAAIEEFQTQNGILLPSLRPALPFLDLHSVSRHNFHQSVMEELRDKLLQRISEVAASTEKTRFKTLNELLNKCFPVVKVSALRPVVLTIMKHLPKIKNDYLRVVMEDKTLYKEAAVEVKQQIWQDHQALFGDEVSPLFGKYIDDREDILFNHESNRQDFFTQSPKARRQDEVVQQLTKMVGTNVKLYDMVLQFLRTLFLRTRNIHYCTLRVELLMSLHDNDINDIVSVDPCHKFTWCLDACIRERFVDSKRARELQGFLDSMRRGHEQVLGDLSMILCDPHAVHTLAVSAIKAVQSTLALEAVPRYNDELVLLLRMMWLGLGAWNMIDSQYFKEPKMDAGLVTRFVPSLMTMMVDDQIQLMNIRKSEDDSSRVEPAPSGVGTACRDNNIATMLLLHYLYQAAQGKDANALCRALSLLGSADQDTTYNDMTLHTIVAYLISMDDEFCHQDVCQTVFDHFFLPHVSKENVLRHLLRLVWWVHHRIVPTVLERVFTVIKPYAQQQSEASRTLYQAVIDRHDSYQPSPVAEPEKLDSPLMAVPPPTPLHPGVTRTPAHPGFM